MVISCFNFLFFVFCFNLPSRLRPLCFCKLSDVTLDESSNCFFGLVRKNVLVRYYGLISCVTDVSYPPSWSL